MTMSATTHEINEIIDAESLKKNFTVTVSIKDGTSAAPKVHVETFLNSVKDSTRDFPRGYVYQSAAWSETLRDAKRVSIAIELGGRTGQPNRMAINQALAGLLSFLDVASEVQVLRIQVLDGHASYTTDLHDVLQPVAIWHRRMLDVDVQYVRFLEDLGSALSQTRRSHSRKDDTMERLFSEVRKAARTAARLEQAGQLARSSNLNFEMARIMANVGFIGVGGQEQAEVAITEIGNMLALIMGGL